MRRRLFVTVIAGLLILASGLSAQKQAQMFLSLTSPDGKRVEGITPQDVTIIEDGAACKTIQVEAVDWPTKLQVLVGNGRSNTNPISPLRDGLTGFFEQIPDGVEMSMYTTSGSPRSVVRPTTDKQKLIDAVSRIGPDTNNCVFFGSLLEASERVDKEKTPSYPMIVTIGSNFSSAAVVERDYNKLQTTLFDHGIKTYVLMNVGSQSVMGGGAQIDIGITAAKIAGGIYEDFNSETRLATLLPEIGKHVAQSIALQSHQYRVTYEPCSKSTGANGVTTAVEVHKEGAVKLSLHGTQ